MSNIPKGETVFTLFTLSTVVNRVNTVGTPLPGIFSDKGKWQT